MPLPLLEGITVAEIGRSIAPSYAGRLLADLGAEVIAIDPAPPREHRDRRERRMDAYLAANKLRAELDLTEPKVLAQIRERADIVIYDGSLENDTALVNVDRLPEQPCVVTVVTPFGMDSPYSHLHEDELFFYALSGIASTTPENAEDASLERPMHPYGHQAAFITGVCAAAAALQAWMVAQQSGRGAVLDVSILDGVSATPIISQMWVFGGHTPTSDSRPQRPMPSGAFRCQDGYVYVLGGSWEALAAALERSEWLEADLGDPEYRSAHMDEVEAAVGLSVLHMTTDDVSRRCHAAGVVAFPINSIREVAEHPQMTARRVFEPIAGYEDDAGSLIAPRTPIGVHHGRGPERSPDIVRAAGADTAYARERLLTSQPATRATTDEHHLPLEGVRVGDFSWVLAGPQCTKWLGALGAEVVKVESRYRPDPYRSVPPFLDDDPTSLEGSVSWNMLNYSKKNCTINLGTQEGQALARRLATVSEVVIENYSTGAAERMGLDYAELVKENPRLVMVSSSGFGHDGPDAHLRAFGKAIHAFAGHTYLTAWPGTPPRGLGGTWTDPTTGMTAALAIFAGLIYTRRTGKSLHFDLSMAESTISLMADPFLEYFSGDDPAPRGNRSKYHAPHNTFRCADGWVAIACHAEQEWPALASLLGETTSAILTLDDRLERVEEIDRAIDAWCGSRSRGAVLAELRSEGVCAAPVLTFAEVLSEPHFRQRGMFVELTKEGIGTYQSFTLPWKSNSAAEPRYFPAPHLGADNDYVYTEVLGLAGSEVEALRGADVLT